VDFNGYFRSFQNGYFRQIEFQRIRNFKFGDNVVGYVDNRSNLRVFDGSKPKDIANLEAEYEVSDNLLVWKIGPTLNMWDDGELRTLSYNTAGYLVKDSIIVFQDTRFNTLNVYYNKEVHTLVTSSTGLWMPEYVGENIVAFRDNGNFYKVFWRGQIYDLDVWHNPIEFHADIDILAFNDPINGTFAIFENGQFLDLEMFHVNKYRAGNNFIVYEDRNNNLVYYHNGETKILTSFGADYWEVKDNIVVWGENNAFYTLYEGEKVELVRYAPAEYAIKNDVIAFRNLMGGVNFYYEGEIHEITNQIDAQFQIHGNSLLVSLFNTSFILFHKGKKYNL
jgi:hypothetical protein